MFSNDLYGHGHNLCTQRAWILATKCLVCAHKSGKDLTWNEDTSSESLLVLAGYSLVHMEETVNWLRCSAATAGAGRHDGGRKRTSTADLAADRIMWTGRHTPSCRTAFRICHGHGSAQSETQLLTTFANFLIEIKSLIKYHFKWKTCFHWDYACNSGFAINCSVKFLARLLLPSEKNANHCGHSVLETEWLAKPCINRTNLWPYRSPGIALSCMPTVN